MLADPKEEGADGSLRMETDMLLRFIFWLLLLPVQLLLLATLAGVELLACLRRLLSSTHASSSSTPTGTSASRLCSIVVLNWDGRHLLQESLPALQRAVRRTGQNHEILVVDNGSRDDSREWLGRHHPEVRVVAQTSNLGFGEGNNRGVQAARHEIVVLLNNDMIVDPDFLAPLLEGFDDPRVFAVTSQIQFPEGKRREETGNARGRWRRGYLELSHEPLQDWHHSRHFLPVLWAGGGSSAFHKERFLALGGFSPLFEPCYLEDTDLSYRAWRRGWTVLLSARSRVLHKHRSSSAVRFSQDQLSDMVERRKLWYVWKNYQLRTLLRHLVWIPFHVRVSLSARAYLGAFSRLPRLLKERFGEPRRSCSDGRLFEWVRRPITFLHDSGPPRLPAARDGADRLRVLVVSAYLPQRARHGGAGRVLELLQRTSERYDTILVTFLETQQEARTLDQSNLPCRQMHGILRRQYDYVSPFPYEPFEEFNSQQLRSRLERLLTQNDFDIIHFEWPQMAQYADLAPFTPKLMTEIEVNYKAASTLVSIQGNPLRKIAQYYRTLQTLYRELQMCRKVDRVVCVTDADRDYLRGYLDEDSLCVLNTGVDIGYFQPDRAASIQPFSMLFVGAYRHYPNVDAMLYFVDEILPAIVQDCPRCQLYIVGTDPPSAIRNLDRHPNVTVTGYVEDIRSYYHMAQVVVVPLRTGVGIRGKILEAWATGKVTVATGLACQGLRAQHGQNILVAEDAAQFALWTLALFRHPEFAERLGQKGRETVERYYDWDTLGDRLAGIYQSMAPLTGEPTHVL